MKIYTKSIILLLSWALILPACISNNSSKNNVEELLKKMTLEEKIGQMTQICLSMVTTDGTKNLNLDEEKMRQSILDDHVGSFISGAGTVKEWVKFNTIAQKIAVEESRLGIPLLFGIDHIHGANYVLEGTILPHNINLSCTFDTSLVKKAAEITAKETAGLRLTWNFSPVMDLGKNPYWPRFYETFGEDPLVCGIMGATFIKHYNGFQGRYSVTACAKHFVGYSDPVSGWDRTPSEIPDQVLYEQFLPPFKNAIDAGVRTVMLNSGELNGEPVHISRWLVHDVLREYLGFNGIIVTDIKDIMKVVEMHSAAINEKLATQKAIDAGIDISMACDSYSFIENMKQLVSEGLITEKRIDASVRRILQLKYDLGLFENPYPSAEISDAAGSVKHQKLAKEMAAASIVLMKNENILPLDALKTHVLLTGHASDSKRMLNGAWTMEWQGVSEERQPADMKSLKDAMEIQFNGNFDHISFEDALSNPNMFLEQSSRSDVVVLTLGEYPYSEFKGNITDLSLPADQLKLADIAFRSGKPVVLILLEGRPRLINTLRDKADAILFAGIPGEGGGEAISDILAGKINPSGKLSFSYPADPGHIVPYYRKPSESYSPEFPFGHGLSYTTFTYEDIYAEDSVVNTNEYFNVSVKVSNTGNISGKETVMLYMKDEVGSITRSVRKLIDFTKVYLDAGESTTIVFRIKPEKQLAYPDKKGQMHLDPGDFTFYSGNQSCSVKLI